MQTAVAVAREMCVAKRPTSVFRPTGTRPKNVSRWKVTKIVATGASKRTVISWKKIIKKIYKQRKTKIYFTLNESSLRCPEKSELSFKLEILRTNVQPEKANRRKMSRQLGTRRTNLCSLIFFPKSCSVTLKSQVASKRLIRSSGSHCIQNKCLCCEFVDAARASAVIFHCQKVIYAILSTFFTFFSTTTTTITVVVMTLSV